MRLSYWFPFETLHSGAGFKNKEEESNQKKRFSFSMSTPTTHLFDVSRKLMITG